VPEGLRLSLTTLTVLPLRRVTQLDRETAGRAMALAPVTGLLLGLTAGGVVLTARLLQAPNLVSAGLGVATLALLTRGLHLDGLADLVDGLASYRDPEGTRAVMKAPDVGPLGVSALVLALLLQTASLSSAIAQHRGTLSLLTAVLAGRVAITVACSGTRAAAPDGMGALVAGTVRPLVARTWLVLLPVLAGAALALDPDATRGSALRSLIGVGACLAATGATEVLRRHALRRVGGITGDVLGALSEVATTVALVVLSFGT
jgi:adenosylcobinamide-GDP ribazoletransferase